MKKLAKALAAIMLMTAVISIVGCSPEKDVKVTTSSPHDITLTTAVCGGEVTASEGITLTELGVCWDTVKDPTVNNDHLSTSSCAEPFECTLTDLTPCTEYHVRAYAYDGSDYYYGEDKTFTTDGGGSGNGGDTPTAIDTLFVDLGLPSGTLWATRNVGANAPEEYGDYFCWAEVEPKETYSFYNYKYYDYNGGKFTKYTSVDGLSVLQAVDDAASANWGSYCRIPSKSEWEELVQNTTHEWTSLNGVKGRLFTANNGNSIFLPAAEHRMDDSKGGDFGCYLSNVLESLEDPDDAWCLYFDQDYCEMGASDERCYGQSVRAVRSAR